MTSKKCWFVLLATNLLMAGCNDAAVTATAGSAKTAPASVSTAAIAAGAVGFTVGTPLSTRTVYVFFDAQCVHCGELWNAAKPLNGQAKFVWIPVSLMNPKSASQGAALLSAANPVELMTSHEAALLSGGGGMSASASMTPEAEAAIKTNTQLFNSLGATSVPYIVAKNNSTGAVITNSGALATPALAAFLGIQ